MERKGKGLVKLVPIKEEEVFAYSKVDGVAMETLLL